MKDSPLTGKVLGSAIEVHKHLGPGLLESVYEQCLAHELKLAKIPFVLQHKIPVNYKGVILDCGHRADIVVENKLVVELKSVEILLPIHEAQLLTYMKLMKMELGLLINFNSRLLKDGIRRIVL